VPGPFDFFSPPLAGGVSNQARSILSRLTCPGGGSWPASYRRVLVHCDGREFAWVRAAQLSSRVCRGSVVSAHLTSRCWSRERSSGLREHAFAAIRGAERAGPRGSILEANQPLERRAEQSTSAALSTDFGQGPTIAGVKRTLPKGYEKRPCG
jgi:hypothetical protein